MTLKMLIHLNKIEWFKTIDFYKVQQIQIMKIFYFIKSILLFCKIRFAVCLLVICLYFLIELPFFFVSYALIMFEGRKPIRAESLEVNYLHFESFVPCFSWFLSDSNL